MNAPTGLHKAAYELGHDPLDWCIDYTKELICVHYQVAAARMDNPEAYPGYCIPLTVTAVARRIIGELMDAGWTPPVVGGFPKPEKERSE